MKPVGLSASVTLLVVCLLIALPALGGYDLSRSTIDGGGVSSGGQYTLRGTVGQPDATYSAGGDYELLGGFWPGEPLCTVNFYHFALFAEHWLQTDCNDLNNWCGGADLDHMNDVDSNDLKLFVDEWLYYCPLGWPLK